MTPFLSIPLTRGLCALIDAADHHLIRPYSWQARDCSGGKIYAAATDGRASIFMHRLILGLEPGDPDVGDHASGDGLDNRRANLRRCSKSQNQHNRGPNRGHQFKGVFRSHAGRWTSQIASDGKRFHLGLFDTPEEAAAAYDAAARDLHGEFAFQNFPAAARGAP